MKLNLTTNKSLFFIKKTTAAPNDRNSITLRIKLAETGKYKVKGLGISCPLKDWNQEEQKVKRSNKLFKKHNDQLRFIAEHIEAIEMERVIRSEEIDTIVEASIKGLSIQELTDKGTYITALLDKIYQDRKDSKAYDLNSINKFKDVKSIIIDFQKKIGYEITAESLNKSSLSTQNEFVEYLRTEGRNEGRKDSSIKAYLKIINTAITYHIKLTEEKVKTFILSDTKWEKHERQIIALTKSELESLYLLAFNPPQDDSIRFTRFEIRNIKLFLFRCFCGMRICDMNDRNINPHSLTKASTSLEYFQDKGVKATTVECIGTYLFDIAESINWDFPEITTENALRGYGRRETAAVRKAIAFLFKGNERKIRHITENGFEDIPLSKEISTHVARRTFAHLLYGLTKDIMLVKDQLGHTDIKQTMSYLSSYNQKNSNGLKTVDLGF